MGKPVVTQELVDSLLKRIENQKSTIHYLNEVLDERLRNVLDGKLQITLDVAFATELTKFVDCYSPHLREVARACKEALSGKG